jgi:hypothetical protein
MTHNIIKTHNYLLIVSDEEIKEGDWHMYSNKDGSLNGPYGFRRFLHNDYRCLNAYKCKKLISHLPLNNSPVLEGVPLLPPLEDEVLELVQAYVINTPDNEPLRVYAFIEGYNKAKEKYKFTDEDIMKAVVFGYRQNGRNGHIDDEEERDFIQSLQQPKMPVAFECEVERIYPNPQTISKEYDFDDILIERKTTTNSQGQAVWVGKYIY